MQSISNIFRSIFATVRFETVRIMRMQRIIVAIIMVLFPPTMILILESSNANPNPELFVAVFSGMICLLSLLLWATSNVYTELEARSWTFVTSRPNGRWAILFGKYFIAVGWSFLVSWLAMTLCLLIPFDQEFQTGQSRFAIWWMFTILLFLASMSYSAIFSLMGVVIQRRAMMFAVGYFIIVEMILWFIPALIGRVAMSHHMVSITFQQLGNFVTGGDNSEAAEQIAMIWGFMDPWVHYLAIFAMTGFCLCTAAAIIRYREYMTLEDSQF